jgi:hypothetical protein
MAFLKLYHSKYRQETIQCQEKMLVQDFGYSLKNYKILHF